MHHNPGTAQPWGTRTPYGSGQPWPARVDMFLADGIGEQDVDRWVRSASVLHSNGDGFDIAVKDDQIVGVRGREQDRVNHGRLGPKDLFGWQANSSPDRLTQPLVRVDGVLVETDWDTAMDRIVEHTRHLLDDQGPSAIGFYTSGQLFLEEYYTLGVIAHGAIGTNHVDGNTRLCTATAAEALKESFASDGQPGSYADIDHADVIALYGHNVAETQTVLWTRMLDRLAGPNPPKLLCVDPRLTEVARHATVHLAPLPGTNMALMNALLHDIIAQGWIDEQYLAAHTVGFADLKACVAEYPPERAADICGLDAAEIRAAARLLGTAEKLLSTVLQGFYQSHQATAAAVQVNNVHLVRGMLGAPGCGVLQMNGQPTAQNTRECGADGDLAGFRNWSNDEHIEQLSRLWNIDSGQIPHYAPPTHAMQMFRYAEQGSIRMLWISATNPAVSMPELARIRAILGQERLFVVAQDIFPTETTELADVVLPAAAWAEKTGTFTNVDRTVHLSDKAVEPPGQARPDLDIFLDFARRMNFRDNDGQQLPPWTDAESAFEAWKKCSAGRPCDYSAMSYDMLRTRDGVQWPCTSDAPEGTERLYAGGFFLQRARLLRELRQRPGHRRPRRTHRLPGAQPRRQSDHQSGTLCPASRSSRRRPPTGLDHRTYPVPFPHPHQNRTSSATAARRPVAVGGSVGRRRCPVRHLRRGSGGGVHPTLVHSCACPGQWHPPRSGVRALPLRVLGHRQPTNSA
ncbi:molybdopterin-dependent oxidoreductase-like protein [Williamsia limnetica]|uniref:Molybdopterin-dependent oxidoreductase-like protein n=1 Tax=Williamsia limnetica TaxID=882452 RepID=A0A318REW0_WILLI|nr:molybdopterin-dependent oxidoreductase-like protein [Williamsia limnetica]